MLNIYGQVSKPALRCVCRARLDSRPEKVSIIFCSALSPVRFQAPSKPALPSSPRLFFQDLFQLRNQGREIQGDRVPNQIEINLKIDMDQAVSHPHASSPGNLRKFASRPLADG